MREHEIVTITCRATVDDGYKVFVCRCGHLSFSLVFHQRHVADAVAVTHQ